MRHYTHRGLTDAFRDGLASLGKAPGTVNQCWFSAAPKGRGSFDLLGEPKAFSHSQDPKLSCDFVVTYCVSWDTYLGQWPHSRR